MRHKIKEFLTLEERDNLLKQPNHRTTAGIRDYCILALMMFTGLRRQEICDLNRSSLKPTGKKLNLYIYGKGKKWRKIPIRNLDLLYSLERYFKRIKTISDPEAPMFFKVKKRGSEKYDPITPATIRFIVDKYTKMAGIQKRITPHSLRHTFITLALQAGADLATVKSLAGHENVQTTSGYLHTTEELMEKAVERLSL